MQKVRIHKSRLYLDKKAIPLISGEVHYWRLNPSYWGEILDRVREMGLNMVSTYVPWHYHEYKKGVYDFTGDTHETRNLKAFLDLAKKKKFWMIIRPGPYIYSEWPNDGVPDYARKYHRLHKQFKAYSHAYMSRVCEVIKPYLASRRGGNIVLFQADNEIDPWPDLYGHQYGLSGKPGMFQEFLRRKYKNDIEQLNTNWDTTYDRFEEAGPYISCMLSGHRGHPLKGDRELRRNLDYFEFKYDYSVQVAQWNVQTYRDLGIDVPIYLNLYPFFYVNDWHEMQKQADMVGIDLYPSSELGEDEHEQRKFIDKIRYTRSATNLSYIPEFSAGIWHARHYESGVLTPNHYRFICLSALMGGVQGWNWYMLVNRDNWYMSPINEWGRTRPELYDVFKQMVDVFKRMDPPALTKLVDVSVIFNPLQYAARTLTQGDLVSHCLYKADIDYDLCNPGLGKPKSKILFYSGNQWMDESSQESLKSYVQDGGILVAFYDYPRKDENLNRCSKVGFVDPSRTLFEFKKPLKIRLGKEVVDMVSSIYVFDKHPGRAIKVTVEGLGNVTIGYEVSIGKGKILHLGVEPNEHLVHAILRHFKIPLYARAMTRDINTTLFQKGKKYYLMVLNNGHEDKSAVIHFDRMPKTFYKHRMRELISGQEEHVLGRSAHGLSLEISRKDGKIIEFSPR